MENQPETTPQPVDDQHAFSDVGQTVILFFRYVAAVIVACVASLTVVLLLAVAASHLGGNVGQGVGGIVLILVGFAGVFAGTFCLPQRSWLSGSIVLLMLGVGFAVFELSLTMTYEKWDSDTGAFSRILLLATGGAGAVVAVFFVRRYKKSMETDPTSPQPVDQQRGLSRTDHALLLAARYAAALLATCATSFIMPFILMMMTLPSLGSYGGFYIVPIVHSFVGVCAAVCTGTFCLPPRRRPFGSIILLTLHFGYRIAFRGFPPSLSMIVGGVAAVVFFFIRERYRKAAEPTDASSLSPNP